jgi:hypothetical protein
MNPEKTTENTLDERARRGSLAASAGLSAEETTQRLKAAARILANGAIRAAIAARQRGDDKCPAGGSA